MNKLLVSVVLGFTFIAPAIAEAAQKSQASQSRAVNRQAATDCNICFTCGGDWPIFAGSIRSVGDFPTERASLCGSTLIGRPDSSPFLCCKD